MGPAAIQGGGALAFEHVVPTVPKSWLRAASGNCDALIFLAVARIRKITSKVE
jgi:hypothetical protein